MRLWDKSNQEARQRAVVWAVEEYGVDAGGAQFVRKIGKLSGLPFNKASPMLRVLAGLLDEDADTFVQLVGTKLKLSPRVQQKAKKESVDPAIDWMRRAAGIPAGIPTGDARCSEPSAEVDTEVGSLRFRCAPLPVIEPEFDSLEDAIEELKLERGSR